MTKSIFMPKGENHYLWGGDNIKYSAIHRWLKVTYGNPLQCEQCDKLGEKNKGNKWNIQWALIKGKKYERKVENFFGLCQKCHMNYDMTDERRKNESIAHLGKKHTEETLNKLRGKTPWNKGLKFA